uniref:Uncharacterized protein n=1 Tax=Anabas testudineus TaxID=64144 RepID=A0A7N6BDM7_ANATE
ILWETLYADSILCKTMIINLSLALRSLRTVRNLWLELGKALRTSYGPLLDNNDYGTLGNFSNPMYDP